MSSGLGCGLGVAVVFADEDDRQFPDPGQVEPLKEGALVGGAVAEEADDDLPAPRVWR